MTAVINLETIQSIIQNIDVIDAMEKGFIAYSNNKSIVPPVGELLFDNPKGDAHIKYGYIKEQEYYVIKVASGFYGNTKLGIPSSQGLMLVFDQKTGVPKCVLLDEGFLTDIRTAAAGALAAKYFAPKTIKGIGIIGTGIQAKLQLDFLLKQTSCKDVWVWGRNADNAIKFANQYPDSINIRIAKTTKEVAANTNIIVTTTPSEEALLKATDIQKGTHITAVGSDTHAKQELESEVLAKADIVIADSIPQSKSRGEIFRAIQDNTISDSDIIELGTAIQNKALQRTNNEQITVVDLTGVAVQDIMIATAVYNTYLKTKS